MSEISESKAAEAFRRFFPEDWRDRLLAWIAARERSRNLNDAQARREGPARP